MDIRAIVKDIGNRFNYRADPFRLFDWWFVMPDRDGRFTGDCEDFSLTAIWKLCNANIWTFIWRVLVLHQYRFYFSITPDRQFHFVGYAQDLWFDNWTKEALTKSDFLNRTGHKIYFFVPSPLIVFNMLLGLLVRNLKR